MYSTALRLGNLALSGPTWQSSITHDGVPSRAVDGNTDPVYNGLSCTHTENEDHPWWAVDLGQTYELSTVTVTNRIVLVLSKIILVLLDTEMQHRAVGKIVGMQQGRGGWLHICEPASCQCAWQGQYIGMHCPFRLLPHR